MRDDAETKRLVADCELRLEELSLEQAPLAKRKSGMPSHASNQAFVGGGAVPFNASRRTKSCVLLFDSGIGGAF